MSDGGRDKDDAASMPVGERTRVVVGELHRPGGVEGDELGLGGQRVVGERPAREDAGAEHDQPDVELLGSSGEYFDRALVEEVELDGFDAGVELLVKLCGDALELVPASCDEHEIESGLGELPRELRADTRGGAGDERVLAVGGA